ncbi:MAG TPA: efflux RND transporter periplasmic adaptor subunit [Gammaproteobacteria bacterium]
MRKFLIFGGVALGLVLLVVTSRMRGEDGPEVEAAAVERHTIESSILASGRIAYRNEVELRSEVIGQVVELLVEEGDRVTQGEVILRLDPETFQAEVEQSQANVRQQEIAVETQKLVIENLERQWRRQRELFEQRLIDESTFENVTNELAIARLNLKSEQQALSQAQAGLSQAEERLDKTVIRAPIDGVVTGVFVKEGETVISGTTNIAGSNLMTISDPSGILTEVQVDEADIANVKPDQRVSVYTAAYPETALGGVVQNIATTARTAEGRQGLSFEVEIRLDEIPENVRLRPGMSARAEIYTAVAENVMAVPIQAILYPDSMQTGVSLSDGNDSGEDAVEEKPWVFVLEDGNAMRREVTLGISDDSWQQIETGLEEGTMVINGPAEELRHLKDGMAVTVADADADKETETEAQE